MVAAINRIAAPPLRAACSRSPAPSARATRALAAIVIPMATEMPKNISVPAYPMAAANCCWPSIEM